MPRLLLILALAITLFAACGGDGDKDPDSNGESGSNVERETNADELRKHEDDLKQAVEDATKAIFSGGAVGAYGYASSDFKAACPLEDFIGIIAFVGIFLGDIDEDDVEVEVTNVRYEEGRAFVTMTGSLAGEDLGSSDEDGDDFSDFWVYEGGAWKFSTDDNEPCDTSFGDGVENGDDDDDDEPAYTGPGSSRNNAVPLGESVDLGNRRITVLEADMDATARFDDILEFESTPEPNRRVILTRVRVEHIGEESDETIEVYESNFQLTASDNLVYDSFEEGVSCGFLADPLDGEMFPGGEIEGYVCFQIPDGVTGPILIAESSSFSFDDDGKRYLALE